MAATSEHSAFVFPKWTNQLRQLAGVALAVVPVYGVLLLWYGASPRTTAVGYEPVQPVPYSHAMHAGKLGMDCRYCHVTVEASRLRRPPRDSNLRELPCALRGRQDFGDPA